MHVSFHGVKKSTKVSGKSFSFAQLGNADAAKQFVAKRDSQILHG